MNKQESSAEEPFFSVIIPTKNRGPYLQHTLRTCSMQNYERLEVIVSDDGSTDRTREIVESAARADPRIRYVSQGTGVGMRDNFELALQQARPGFVIALGGDDGLLPDGIQGMRDVLLSTGTELLAWPAPSYSYPGVTSANGQLAIYRRRDTKVINSREFLSAQARHLHYLGDIESPMFYVKGVASTRLIEQVRSRSKQGRFYSCPTPDGYSGIVLAGEVERYAFSGKPFSIFGQAPTSQGLAYLSNDPKAKHVSADFFKSVAATPMHRELAGQPYSPLITLMTVDYLLTCKDLPGWPGRFPEIDYRQVLLKSVGELTHGLYGEDRICRELAILEQIAAMHGLSDFFARKVRHSRRHRKRPHFEGYGINSTSFFLDGKAYNLSNVFDAAYAANNIYKAYSDLTPSRLASVFARSLAYRFRYFGTGAPFPPRAHWTAGQTGSESIK